jgi:GT2 family glycosyltransferase
LNLVTYVLPVYGKPGLLTACLSSFRKFHPDSRVIVVNDAGPDDLEMDSIATFYNAEFISRATNGGFAAAVNEGIRAAGTPYVCLVNDDLEFTRPVEDVILNNFERDPKIAVLGGLLLYPDGRIEHGGGYYNYFGAKHYGEKMWPHQAKLCGIPAYRFFVTGALMALKSQARFDETYINDSEDAALCVDMWINEARVFYDPEFTAIHHKSQTLNDPTQLETAKERWPKRMESNKRFRAYLETVDIENIELEINRLNLEIHPELPEAFVRTNALGDVLRSLRVYRQLPKPGMVVITRFPEVFRGEEIYGISDYREEFAVSSFIDLDLSYERRPHLSIESSYEKTVYGKPEQPDFFNEPIEFKTTELDWFQARRLSGHDWENPFVVFHGRQGNPNRSADRAFWASLAEMMTKSGFHVIMVGDRSDTMLQGQMVHNLVGQTSLGMLRALLEHAALFIGMDSGPLHVADGACPAIGIFTIAEPNKRVSAKVTPYVTPAPCHGCLHRQKPPLCNFTCEFPPDDPRQYMCTGTLRAEIVFQIALETMKK